MSTSLLRFFIFSIKNSGVLSSGGVFIMSRTQKTASVFNKLLSVSISS
jgi:hypothetical protein